MGCSSFKPASSIGESFSKQNGIFGYWPSNLRLLHTFLAKLLGSVSYSRLDLIKLNYLFVGRSECI